MPQIAEQPPQAGRHRPSLIVVGDDDFGVVDSGPPQLLRQGVRIRQGVTPAVPADGT